MKIKVNEVSKAAVLANEYVPTHEDIFGKQPQVSRCNLSVFCPNKGSDDLETGPTENGVSKVRPFCVHCKKRGHTISDCFC